MNTNASTTQYIFFILYKKFENKIKIISSIKIDINNEKNNIKEYRAHRNLIEFLNENPELNENLKLNCFNTFNKITKYKLMKKLYEESNCIKNYDIQFKKINSNKNFKTKLELENYLNSNFDMNLF